MKVKIKTGINRWSFNGQKYFPGDTLDIPVEAFVPYIHEVVEAPPVVEVPEPPKTTPITVKVSKKNKPAEVVTDEQSPAVASADSP
jgi:hypothetical protein